MNGTGRRALVTLLSASAASLVGTRLSMIALPWFVLETTGSPTRMGVVGFCEMAPYVVVQALGGPVIDRFGPRRISVASDWVSLVLVGAVPVLHHLDLLPFAVLVGLVAAAGAARGPGDAAKIALVPEVAATSGAPLARITGLQGTIERLSTVVGPALAGVVVTAFGPLSALLADAASFGVAALLVTTMPVRRAPVEAHHSPDTYVEQLGEGFAFLRQDRLLRAIVGMVGITNMLDSALFMVLLPVWADETGRGPAAVGGILAAMGTTAVAGSAMAAAFGHRLPQRTTFLVGFLVAGAPRFFVLASGAGLGPVVAVFLIGGLGGGFLNPILAAAAFERIPEELIGRVGSLLRSLPWAGIPLGGMVGPLVALAGLAPTLSACGAVYLAVTTLAFRGREWHELGRPRAESVPVRVVHPDP